VSEEQIRKWKNQDKWDKVTLPNAKSNVTNRKGGQPGNKNAVGHGGTGPPGNKNAVKHGAYEQIYYEALPEEERSLFDSIPDTAVLDGEIKLLRLKLARLIGRSEIKTYDMFGGEHKREITEAEREKGILEVTAELRKLIKTKKQIEIAELKAGGGDPDESEDDGFMAALEGTAAEDWEDEE
ncbi:MAG: phage terminase small subunit, partial [Hungatella hathewayi]|nr:phage terminase small subunit [Hungatella hathewayi]